MMILFFHPYTKIEFLQKDMMVGRQTAAKYLDKIVDEGLLQKLKMGRDNYYVNIRLMELFMNHSDNNTHHVDLVESKTE